MSDYTTAEYTVAAFVALSVPVWTMVLINLSELASEARAPAIAPGDAVPIQVQPVLDLEKALPKLGGGKARMKMPDMWSPPDPSKFVEREATVSTQAGQTEEDIPPQEVIVSDGAVIQDPDAATAFMPGEGSDGGDVPEGPGDPGGSPKGEGTDPLRARAMILYAGRIQSFLKAGFGCPSLSEEEKKSCRPSASVSVSGDTVTGFSFSPSGTCGGLDSAARSSIASKVGQSIPPPPENYPDFRRNSWSVTYVCD